MAIGDERTRATDSQFPGRFGQDPQRPLTRTGQMFEKARKAHGWSYAEVGKRAGIKSGTTYGMVIRGTKVVDGEVKPVKVSADMIAKYALALGLNVRQALQAAGYKDNDVTYKLDGVPSEQLWGELRRRGELTEMIAAELRARAEDPGDTPGQVTTPHGDASNA